MAAIAPDDAKKFIDGLGESAISSLTGSTLSPAERATRFRAMMVAHFDMPAISKFSLGRYWKIATPEQQTEFQKLFEDLPERLAEILGSQIDARCPLIRYPGSA